MVIFDSVKKAKWKIQMLQTPQIYGIFKLLKDIRFFKTLCLYVFVYTALSMDILYLFWKKIFKKQLETMENKCLQLTWNGSVIREVYLKKAFNI